MPALLTSFALLLTSAMASSNGITSTSDLLGPITGAAADVEFDDLWSEDSIDLHDDASLSSEETIDELDALLEECVYTYGLEDVVNGVLTDDGSQSESMTVLGRGIDLDDWTEQVCLKDETSSTIDECLMDYGVMNLATTLIVDAGYTGSSEDDSCGGSKYLNCMQTAQDKYNACVKKADETYPDKADPDLQSAKGSCQNDLNLEQAACAANK